MDEGACHHAAFNGHVHALEFLRQHNCPWNQYTCEHALRRMQLPTLQWLVAQGCPINVRDCIEVARYMIADEREQTWQVIAWLETLL
jgi:ankyrin repeat protein